MKLPKIAFLVNSTIKKHAKILREIEVLFADAFELEIFNSTHAGHIVELTKEAISKGHKSLILVGGDGTLNEGINGLFQAFKRRNGYNLRALRKINLGVLPSGSGNDFCRSLGVGSDPFDVLKAVLLRETEKIDVGKTSFTGLEGEEVERFFLNITDVGMGGMVAEKMQKGKAFWGANFSYIKAIAETFLSYKKTSVRYTADEGVWQGKIMSLVIANGKYFGSGLGIAPKAELNDGYFRLTRLGDISILDYIKYLGPLKKLKILDHPQINYSKTTSILIESTNGSPLPIDMDGEYVGFCPMKVECLKEAVSFFVAR